MKKPYLLIKGFETFKKLKMPSVKNPMWTATSLDEAIEYVTGSDESGLIFFYIKNNQNLRTLDISNKKQSKIFGNVFVENVVTSEDGSGIYFFSEYITELLDEYDNNINEVYEIIQDDFDLKIDNISKQIILKINNIMKKTANRDEKFLDNKIFPIFAEIALNNNYNTIAEYVYSPDAPSFVFFSDDLFNNENINIFKITNKNNYDMLTDISDNTSKFIKQLNVYDPKSFAKLIKIYESYKNK